MQTRIRPMRDQAMMSRRAAIALTVISAASVRSVSNAIAQTPVAGDPLPVVATFSVLGDLIRAVGGDAIDLQTVVDVGMDAHTFEATPANAIALSEAGLVFAIGLGFEPWLAQLAEGADGQFPVVTLTDGLDLIAGEGHGHDHAHDEEKDPHVWLDVQNAIAMTDRIRAALVEADPENATSYDANAAAATANLEELDAWIVEQVATLPEGRRKLVTSHDTFAYFARRYGFDVVGSVQGLSTEEGEPSAMEIATLTEEIKAAGVPVVFAETVSNPALVESVAREAGVTLGPPLYTDSLGPAGSDGATYDGMMRHNVTAIVTALAG